METELVRRLALLILLGSTILVQPSDALAQRRGVETRRPRRPAVVVHTPTDHMRVIVGPKEYHYAHGVFYRPAPKGYVAIRGPIGARIKHLPVGYLTFEIGGAPFFFYYGTYYQRDPVSHDYIVVAPPAGAPVPPGLDRIDLISGETINGTYLGGTQSTVQVEINGNVREIPVEQIVSIIFAPPEQ